MTEQRRAAQGGSEGLSQSWKGVLARAKLRARYMSIYRRLLTVGMRPLAYISSLAPGAAGNVHPSRSSSDEDAPGMSRRRTVLNVIPSAPSIAGPPAASPTLRRSISAKETAQLMENPSQRSVSNPLVDDDLGHGLGTGPGGSPAELRRLAEQIRSRASKGISVARRYGLGSQRELQVQKESNVDISMDEGCRVPKVHDHLLQ